MPPRLLGAALFLLSSGGLVLLACPAIGFLVNGLRGAGQGLAIAILILVAAYAVLLVG